MSRTVIIGILVMLALAGCRGTESDAPPIHLNLNMDHQQRFEAQEANAFFENDAAMRPLVPGTVARGMLQENVRFFEGRIENGQFVEEMPVPLTRALLERGQERYNIYCAVCHGRAGAGQGVIMTGDYGYAPAPSYHIDRLRQAPDGYLFDVISNGIRNMPAYGAQVPVADRWAIVAYVRALQHSQYATAEDLPPSILARVEARAGGNIEGGRNVALDGVGAGADTAAATGAVQGDAPAAGDTSAAGTPAASSETADAGEAADPGEETAPAPQAEEPEAAPADTAAAAASDSAAGSTAGAGTPVATGEPGTTTQTDLELGDEGGLSTTLLIVLFVVLPIIALMVLLVTAFRKKREH